MFRGRKLVLQYTGGSPCGSTVESRSSEDLDELDEDGYPARTLNGKVVGSSDDDDEDEDKPKKPKKPAGDAAAPPAPAAQVKPAVAATQPTAP